MAAEPSVRAKRANIKEPSPAWPSQSQSSWPEPGSLTDHTMPHNELSLQRVNPISDEKFSDQLNYGDGSPSRDICLKFCATVGIDE